MRPTFRRYSTVGHFLVRGFLTQRFLGVLGAIDAAQRQDGVSGAIAEIGVHHGKLFLGLNLLQDPGQTSVAIDVFGDQELNVDASGRGDYELFVENMQQWSSMDDVVVHQGDSTRLTPEELTGLAGGPIRLFSVDGGHTEAIVASDLRLAEATLVAGGVVIADDVFNPQWPGVATGTVRYLDASAALVPFFIGFNKVLLTQPEYVARYRAAVEVFLSAQRRVEVATSVFAGHDVCIALPLGAAGLLRRVQAARTLYHGGNAALRKAVRAALKRR